MHFVLTIVEGPGTGKSFAFDRHNHFFVGRAKFAHFRLPDNDPYFSRMHFMVEVNPPACRLLDLGSTNGTFVNGQLIQSVDLRHGDLIQGGDTLLRVSVLDDDGDADAAAPTMLKRPGKATSLSAVTAPFLPDGVLEIDTVDPPGPNGWSIPGYILEQQIGSGGMGVVYRARKEGHPAPVAIKILKPAVMASALEYQRFLREIDILRQLDHPAIVRLLDAGNSDELLYFVMELIEGENARSWVERQSKPLPPTIAIGIISRILDALADAHRRGFVHRDVKPANILIRKDGKQLHVKLSDFGLARAYQESKLSGLTLTGDICGTPKFIAPEQITDSRNVRPAADQYSAAAALYWLLTKQHSHDFATGIPRVLQQILLEEPVSLRDRRPDILPGLAAIIHRALNKDPDRRYASVNEFRAELQAWIQTPD